MKPAIFLMLAAAMAACGGADNAVPRREAFPRPAEYDTVYARIDSLPVRIEVNAQARRNVQKQGDGSYWIDIAYPKYGAQIYCTLTPVTAQTVQEVVDNRFERILLNLNGREPETFAQFGGKYSGALVYEPKAVNTPVQFVAAPLGLEGEGWAVTGTAFFFDVRPGAPVDSLRPMTEAIYRDMNHLIEALE